MRLGYHSITWGGVVGHPMGVTSVKDLYYLANGSMDAAIHDIAAAGYEGTEMFDGNVAAYADRPDELRRLLTDADVELVSVYTGANFVYDDILVDELHRIRHAADLAAIFGAGHLVVGGGAKRSTGTTDQDYDRLAAALDQVCDIAEAAGVTATYHPHLSTIVEGPSQIDRLLDDTRIGFCPDTAHLAAGGGDPAELIRRYPDRIGHIHLKDVHLDPLEFRPLGEGGLDFSDISAAIRDSGYDGWLMVELDDYPDDPRVAAEISKAYLDRLVSVTSQP